MRTLFLLLMCLAVGGLVPIMACAQEPSAGVIFFQHRQFKIPFKNDQTTARITQVRLYVSTNQGRTWQYTATAAPIDQHFRFSTLHDGLYWFTVQTVDQQGKQFPAGVDDFKPNLKVIVDTVPPVVQVQPVAARNGEVGVSWSVRDDNLDTALPDAVRVEYRVAGSATWLPVTIPGGGNQATWDPRSNGQVEVRVLARDRAGNVGEDRTTVRAGANPQFNNPNLAPQVDPLRDLQRKFVNSKQISLSYELKDVGPSGVSSVELWYSLYKGRTWNRLADFPLDVKNPGDATETKKLTFKVDDEGIYGISLVAKSGVGLGDRPPRAGEAPQFWIEVDLTKPVVQLQDVLVGNGSEKGKLSLAWTARDKNLGPMPIRLAYAEDKSGPWNTLAEKLPNTGKYVWKMPEPLPYQFYVRVEAIDLAGNIGEAITFDKIKVDLSLPKVKIRDIEPSSP
ncbi:MAG: hypothetical protein HYX68_03335 [Planctomycetes bacterium]|nr:hypothetical protein [Planctomycetota bacterium]